MIAAELFQVSPVLHLSTALPRYQTNIVTFSLDQIVLDIEYYRPEDESTAVIQAELFQVPSASCILMAL